MLILGNYSSSFSRILGTFSENLGLAHVALAAYLPPPLLLLSHEVLTWKVLPSLNSLNAFILSVQMIPTLSSCLAHPNLLRASINHILQ